MSEPDPNKPLPPTNPTPKDSKPPQEENAVTVTSSDNPAF